MSHDLNYNSVVTPGRVRKLKCIYDPQHFSCVETDGVWILKNHPDMVFRLPFWPNNISCSRIKGNSGCKLVVGIEVVDVLLI